MKPEDNPKQESATEEKLKSLLALQDAAPMTQWEQFKRLGVFQLKLACDALRDLLLSPISIIATAIDISDGKQGKNSYFERLLEFGRRTDRKINLFNLHDDDEIKEFTVDTVVNQIESIVKKEYQEGELSGTAKKALEKSIQALKKVSKSKE